MGNRAERRTHTWIVAAVTATILAAAVPDDRSATDHIRTGLLAIGMLTVLGAAVDVLASRSSSSERANDRPVPSSSDESRRSFSMFLQRQQDLCDELSRRLEIFDTTYSDAGRDRDALFADLRKQVAELRRENHRLIDLDRARDDFVAVAAHELKTPLTAMISHLEILRHYGVGLEPVQREDSLAALTHEAARVSRLIDEMLELARVRSGRAPIDLSTFDLRDVVTSVQRTLSPLALERSLRVTLQPRDTPLDTFADPERVEQIVTNLIANAIKYTAENGTISVRLADDEEFVLVEVTDDGPGIEPEERELVFEAFYRGRRHGEVEGTGIGLHLSREIARRMRGDLTIEDAPDGGARFVLRLPAPPQIHSS